MMESPDLNACIIVVMIVSSNALLEKESHTRRGRMLAIRNSSRAYLSERPHEQPYVRVLCLARPRTGHSPGLSTGGSPVQQSC